MSRFDCWSRVRVVALGLALIAFAGALPMAASAQAPQDQAPQVQAPAPQAPAQEAPAAAPDAAPAPALSDEQIAQLVAPIALYPDNLLAQVLTASTYPLEVVMAARWAKSNPNVKGDALDAAMQNQGWDPSVKGLAAVPQVLDMMSEQLDWTQQLGEAYLAQPDDISDAVQKLRAKAEASGNLKTSKELRVTRAEPSPDPAPGGYAGPYYVIEPAEPDIVYVPVYDPVVVYGGWAYPAYRPFYWRPRNYVYVGVFGFGSAFIVRSALWSRYDWRQRRIYIDVNRYNRFNRTRFTGRDLQWRHDPRHRGTIGYRNPVVRAHFSTGRPTPAGVPKSALTVRGTAAPKAPTGLRVGPAGTPKTVITPRVTPAMTPKPKAVVAPKTLVAPRPAVTPRVAPAPKVVTPRPTTAVAPRVAPRVAPKPAATVTPRVTPRVAPRVAPTVAPRVAPRPVAAPRVAPKPAPRPAANPAAPKKKKPQQP